MPELFQNNKNVTHWMLTWETDVSPWDDFKEAQAVCKKGETYSTDWSCSNKDAKTGDIVWLLQLIKSKPIGVMAKGIIKRSSYKDEQWNPANERSWARYVDVDFTEINNIESDSYITIDQLPGNWGTISGIEIKQEHVLLIEEIWSQITDKEEVVTIDNKQPLNSILYGPPGTGKTFHTINKALEILDPLYLQEHKDDRDALKDRYNQLSKEDRIGFVTFHQSFSYEDFVEGIRAEPTDNGIGYYVKPGIFKMMASPESPELFQTTDGDVDISNKKIWKMSLGEASDSSNIIYERCIDNSEIRLGNGKGIDFTGCSSKGEIKRTYMNNGVDVDKDPYRVTSINIFINEMAIGDLVIITEGNHKFRAIGEITGGYQFDQQCELKNYSQVREVSWLRVYAKALHYEKVMQKKFSQMAIYSINDDAINRVKLKTLLLSEKKQASEEEAQKERVLIIDEINRGNMSSIFGELITLIEPSKRAGASESLTVTLPYSQDSFSVPDNLYIIGTMNTADRSLALMDTALRRRFEFIEMMPDYSQLTGLDIKGIKIDFMLKILNERITALYDREHTLGHAFFMPLKDESLNEDQKFEMLKAIFSNNILPLLEEYFFEDWEKIRLVLGDNQKESGSDNQFFEELHVDAQSLFGKEDAQLAQSKSYTRNSDALSKPEAYRGIYEPS